MNPNLKPRLVDLLSDAPIAYDLARADEAAANFSDLDLRARKLIEGAAGCAPYLDQLIRLDPDFTRACFNSAPDVTFDSIIDDMASHQGPIAAALRIAKRRAALLIALCDLGGVWDVTQVTGALSAFADAAISRALDHLLAAAVADGRIESAAGLFVLGLGKLGARELNYSSDVDLIVFFDPEKFRALGSKSDTERGIAIVQALVRLIQDKTADGYVFRVDLRLRPDPGATPVALSTMAAETYYASRGQVWERAAFIKARTIAGDMAAGDAFLAALTPFVYRRHLDYAAIEEIHDIKRRINAHAGHGDIAVAGHDIKIGRGGIREIEFFAQGLQLINGGREAKLRSRRTLAGLSALADMGIIQPRVFRELSVAYRYLRQVEHRLQMVSDEQTQRLPKTEDGLNRIACFMGIATTERFAETLKGHLECVAAHYDALFADTDAPAPAFTIDGPDSEARVVQALQDFGFKDANSAVHILRAWIAGRPPCLADARARRQLSLLLPTLLAAIGQSDDPAGGLARFDQFIQRLPAGLQFFHVLQANPRLINLLVEVLANAPRLARLLAEQADSFDAVIAPGFFEDLPREKTLIRALSRRAPLDNVDEAIDTAHRHAREARLRVGLQLLTGRVGAQAAGPFLSDLAAAVIGFIRTRVEQHFISRHGSIPGAEFAVLGFGRLGGRELTVTSDLDLVFVYAQPVDAGPSDGPEPLDPVTWHLRLSQRLIAALTANGPDGPLFDVDMRLRPTGNKGPIAVSIERLRNYYADEAWTYELMALTRARVISSPERLRGEIEQFQRGIIATERSKIDLLADIRAMRQRVAQARPASHHWQLKETDGGLIDIEFAAQALVLAHASAVPDMIVTDTYSMLQNAQTHGLIDTAEATALQAALILQLDLQQVMRVALDGAFDPAHAPDGLATLLARTGQTTNFADLSTHLAAHQQRAATISARILAG
jgi:glutamate-ammonia-ligase adenylyltransferase